MAFMDDSGAKNGTAKVWPALHKRKHKRTDVKQFGKYMTNKLTCIPHARVCVCVCEYGVRVWWIEYTHPPHGKTSNSIIPKHNFIFGKITQTSLYNFPPRTLIANIYIHIHTHIESIYQISGRSSSHTHPHERTQYDCGGLVVCWRRRRLTFGFT